MDLVVDIGNSDTVFGLIRTKDLELVDHWRIRTRKDKTADEHESFVQSILGNRGFSPSDLRHVVVGSVVPNHTLGLVKGLENLGRSGCVVVEPSSQLPVSLQVDEPLTVGVDRIVNTLAAKVLYDRDVLVVDCGTATSFDCITAEGVFIGGVIAPGIEAGADWLAEKTAKLPSVELFPPEKVIGKRTEECVRSGIFFSSVDAVDGIVNRIELEWGISDLSVVVTGGYGELVSPHLKRANHHEPFLTLYGLALAGRFIVQGSVDHS